MSTELKGKLLGFDIMRQSKSLLKLKDGNYIEIVLVIHKVLKSDTLDPKGNPVYAVTTGTSFVVFKPEEIAQFEET